MAIVHNFMLSLLMSKLFFAFHSTTRASALATNNSIFQNGFDIILYRELHLIHLELIFNFRQNCIFFIFNLLKKRFKYLLFCKSIVFHIEITVIAHIFCNLIFIICIYVLNLCNFQIYFFLCLKFSFIYLLCND